MTVLKLDSMSSLVSLSSEVDEKLRCSCVNLMYRFGSRTKSIFRRKRRKELPSESKEATTKIHHDVMSASNTSAGASPSFHDNKIAATTQAAPEETSPFSKADAGDVKLRGNTDSECETGTSAWGSRFAEENDADSVSREPSHTNDDDDEGEENGKRLGVGELLKEKGLLHDSGKDEEHKMNARDRSASGEPSHSRRKHDRNASRAHKSSIKAGKGRPLEVSTGVLVESSRGEKEYKHNPHMLINLPTHLLLARKCTVDWETYGGGCRGRVDLGSNGTEHQGVPHAPMRPSTAPRRPRKSVYLVPRPPPWLRAQKPSGSRSASREYSQAAWWCGSTRTSTRRSNKRAQALLARRGEITRPLTCSNQKAAASSQRPRTKAKEGRRACALRSVSPHAQRNVTFKEEHVNTTTTSTKGRRRRKETRGGCTNTGHKVPVVPVVPRGGENIDDVLKEAAASEANDVEGACTRSSPSCSTRSRLTGSFLSFEKHKGSTHTSNGRGVRHRGQGGKEMTMRLRSSLIRVRSERFGIISTATQLQYTWCI